MIEESQSFDGTDFLQADGGLSLAYHSFDSGIPETLARSCSHVKKIDLTETNMRLFSNLRLFTNLETLIVDKNDLAELSTFPVLSTLQTFWCNNNCIADLPGFFDDICVKFPNLLFLSMMRNPCCPGYIDIVNPDIEAIRLYRLYVLYRYPQLLVLDCENVADAERDEAKRRGQYAFKRKTVQSGSPLPVVKVSNPCHDSPADNEKISSSDSSSCSSRSGGFIKVAGGASRQNSRNSEGNRFIVNSQL